MPVTSLVRLYQSVPNSGTITFPYPPGEGQSSPRSVSGNVLVDNHGNIYTTGFTLSFDANNITLTNTSLGTLSVNRQFRIQYDNTSPLLISASRALTNKDNGATLVCNSAVTITVPAGLTKDFGCAIAQMGASAVTITGSGATIRNADGHTTTGAQYGMVSLIAVGADEYVLSGNTA